MTWVCKLENDQARIRFLIHRDLLSILIKGFTKKFNNKNHQQPYLECLYKAIFITTYFGLFRIGEVTDSTHVVKVKDVHIADNKPKILFMLHTSKIHNRGDKPQIIKLSATKSSIKTHKVTGQEICCPFTILQAYLKIRRSYKSVEEQFFVFRDRSPVTPVQFRNVLKSILRSEGFDERFYSGHSFRIGRSQDLWKMGLSIDQIRKLGRWSEKSNVVYTYLK